MLCLDWTHLKLKLSLGFSLTLESWQLIHSYLFYVSVFDLKNKQNKKHHIYPQQFNWIFFISLLPNTFSPNWSQMYSTSFSGRTALSTYKIRLDANWIAPQDSLAFQKAFSPQGLFTNLNLSSVVTIRSKLTETSTEHTSFTPDYNKEHLALMHVPAVSFTS